MRKRQKEKEREIERKGRALLVVNSATWKEGETESEEAREREIWGEKDI